MTRDAAAPAEQQLMSEIRGLADRVRTLRTKDGRLNEAQIKSLEEQTRSKWEQVRRLRAGPVEMDRAPERRSLYR